MSQSGELAAKHEVITIDLSLLPTPPRIASTYPISAAVNVPLTATVNIVFSEPLDRSQRGREHAHPGHARRLAVEGNVTLSPNSRVISFRPAAPLKSETAYTLTVVNTVKDLTGNPLAKPLIMPFTTVDRTAPQPSGVIAATIPNAEGLSTVTGSARAPWTRPGSCRLSTSAPKP